MDNLMKRFESMDPEERNRMKTMLSEKAKGNTDNDSKVDWMYKQEKPKSEEYLLGRRVDKHVEEPQIEIDKNAPGSKFQEIIARRTEMDMKTKMREDPLFAIRERETDAKKKLLQNPMKLKQIQKLIEERNEKEKLEKSEKKIMKKKKKAEDTDELLHKYMQVVDKQKERHTSDYKPRAQKNYGLIDAESGERIETKHRERRRSSSPHGRGHDRHREQYKGKDRYRGRERSRSPYNQNERKHDSKRKLTRDEMAAKRDEMSSSAEWRNQQRKDNVKIYEETSRIENQREKKNNEMKGGSFVKPMMMKGNTTVEDRIKRNMFNVQRTKADLDGNFLRK